MTDLTHRGARDAGSISRGDAANLLGFRDVATVRSAEAIEVQRVPAAAYSDWGAAFGSLAARADSPNPFMSPASVKAARLFVRDDDLVVLAARSADALGRPLIGVWVLRRMRDLWSLGVEVLQTPLTPKYDCQSAPVLDREHAEAALDALMRHLRSLPGLPRLIRATSWPVALAKGLPSGVRVTFAERWSRAILCGDASMCGEEQLKAGMGGSYKKRLAQERALHRAGHVDVASLRKADAVAAFADFVALEHSGWKGKAGTSLAHLPSDAAYMRATIEAHAADDRLSVDVIRLDGVPVAIGLVVEAGEGSVFWKTAFDERFSRFSPGVLLDMAVTRRLFREGKPMLDSGMMEFTDPGQQIWAGRAPLARATIDLGSGALGWLAGLGLRTRHRLRLLRHRRGG